MIKVIRLNKREYNMGKTFNNLHDINDAAATAKGMVGFRNQIKRRMYRNFLINKSKIKVPIFPVTHRDIKRIECPGKCEIPVNIVEILEVVVEDVRANHEIINYEANDDRIISEYMLENIVLLIKLFNEWLRIYPEGEQPCNDKYRRETAYIVRRLGEFNQKYPGTFDSLFNN